MQDNVAPGKALNPWFSIWTRPRATMRTILDTDPTRMVVLLAMIGGISNALDNASARSLGDTWALPSIFVLAAIGGSIAGLIEVYLGGLIMRWTGRWIGGQGSLGEIRAAIAWSNVPLIWALLLWIPSLALYGEEMFLSEAPRMDANWVPAILLGIADVVVLVWWFFVYLECLGETQGFSAGKALGNTLLTTLVVTLPIIVVFGLVRLTM